MSLRDISGVGLEEKDRPKAAFSLITRVAGLGIAPSLEDYEPSVLLYTTPHDKKIISGSWFFGNPHFKNPKCPIVLTAASVCAMLSLFKKYLNK